MSSEALRAVERSLIGTLLCVPCLIDRCKKLDGTEFLEQDYARVFDTLRRFRKKSKPWNMETVVCSLEGVYGDPGPHWPVPWWVDVLGEALTHVAPEDQIVDQYVDILISEGAKRVARSYR